MTQQRPSLLRYGLAASSVFAALSLTRLLSLEDRAPFPLLLGAVLISAWYGGTGPALLATVLAFLGSAYYFFLLAETLKTGSPEEILALGTFLLVASLIIYLDASRRKTEKELRESEERYRALVELSPDAIFLQCDGQFAFANNAALKLLGAGKLSDLIGKSVLDYVHPDYHDSVKEQFRLAREENRGVAFVEEKLIQMDGSTVTVELAAGPLVYQGKPAAQVVVRDLTERIGLQGQLLHAQKLEAVGRLAGGIAHDFNNILTAIIGYSELMLRNLGPESDACMELQEIKAAGHRAALLTRQLLAFSRKQVLAPRVLELNSVLAGMDDMLRRLIGEDVELAMLLSPSLGRVKADPGQIEQVLMNLVVNARDAMPKGGRLTIETNDVFLHEEYVRLHVGAKPGRFVMLAVSDTGMGMDEETKSHVFEPFFSTKGPGKGTGLGLSTVFGIVKQSGGNIWVYSELGTGTTFKIYLPLIEDTPEERKSSGEQLASFAGTETVLVVEDDRMLRELVEKVLSQKGYRVLLAENGVQAIEIAEAEEGTIHLLLTDVIMPRLGGRELAQRVAPAHNGMRVLYMSGYTDDAIVNNGIISPGTSYLQKPFTPVHLLRKVRETLD